MKGHAAIRKYVAFHQHEPKRVGEFHADMKIPSTVALAGPAVNVLYRSDKLNPTTGEDEGWIDYIHEHSRGVNVYRCDRSAPGDETTVPAWIRNATELTWLGDCLGFEWKNASGKNGRGDGKSPLPELYCTANGKCLLVIQGKRRVVAMIWGGKLGVEPRGIVH